MTVILLLFCGVEYGMVIILVLFCRVEDMAWQSCFIIL